MKPKGFLRLLAGTAAVLLMLPVFGCASQEAESPTSSTQPVVRGTVLTETDYTEVAANPRFTLSCNPVDGGLLLVDRQTGRTYRSNPENAKDDPLAKGITRTNMRSQLLITVADQKGNVDPYNSSVDAVGEGGLTVFRAENGVVLDYHFKRLGITVPLAITLGEDGISARLLLGETKEENEKYRLISVGVLPYFAAAGPEDEGYILLPDGSGALIRFNNGKIAFGDYTKTVYGNDDYESGQFRSRTGQPVMLPLFGMHFDGAGDSKEAGFVAMTTAGGAEATLNATPGGVNCSYNNAYFSFNYHTARAVSVLSRTWAEKTFNMVSGQTASAVDPVVEYRFLSSETAGYTDMAALVSQQLQLRGASAQSAAPSLVLDVYNSVVKLGYTLGIPHDKPAVVTDFAQTAAILQDFEDENITLRLLGWDEDGAVGGSVRTKYRPASVAGGRNGLKSLIDYAGEQGVSLYLEAEPARFTKGSLQYNALFHAATQVTNKPMKVYAYRRSTNERNTLVDTYSLLTPRCLPTVIRDLAASLPAGANLSMGSINQYPYADFGKPYFSREQTAGIIAQQLAQLAAERDLYGENPAWYALPYISVAADIPLSSSEYDFFDESVPFVPLVLRGLMTVSTPSVNLSGEPQRVFLRAVETGCSLKFSFIGCAYEEIRDTQLNTLYGAEYALWKEEAARYQAELETALQGLDQVAIREHRMLTATVALVRYENDVEILVNYGHEAYTADGDTVEAQSWLRRTGTGGGSL